MGRGNLELGISDLGYLEYPPASHIGTLDLANSLPQN